jgi:hypothetical protein
MDELGAEFDWYREPAFVVRPYATADAPARFEHEHRCACTAEFSRCGEPRRPGTDNYNVMGQSANPDNGW